MKRSVLIVFRTVYQTDKGLPTETSVSGFNASPCTTFWFSRSRFCRTVLRTENHRNDTRAARQQVRPFTLVVWHCQTQIFRLIIKIVNGEHSAASRLGRTVVINNYYRIVVVNKLTRSERSFSNFPQS